MNDNENPILCHCGKPLHYINPATQRSVEAFIRDLGENVELKLESGTFLIPRHYIALHGLNAADVPKLGFKKVESET